MLHSNEFLSFFYFEFRFITTKWPAPLTKVDYFSKEKTIAIVINKFFTLYYFAIFVYIILKTAIARAHAMLCCTLDQELINMNNLCYLIKKSKRMHRSNNKICTLFFL